MNTKVTVTERKHYQLKDIIKNLKKSDTCKIQSTIANKFISSVSDDEEIMNWIIKWWINIEIIIYDEVDEVIK